MAETDEVFNSPADREAVIGAFFVFIPAAAMCVAGAAAHAFDALSLIVLGLVFGSLIWAMVLVTRTAAFIELSPEQITVGLAPFWKTRLRRREVTQIKVAQVDTYGEYGGWGIKGSAGSSRGRLSVGGDTAVRIEMRDGRAYVVAFKDSKAVERVRRALHAES